MVLQIDNMRGHGGLVKISPRDETYFGYPYYRLFGLNITLAYIMDLIEKPQETRKLNYAGVYGGFTSSLDQVIESLSKSSGPGELTFLDSQIRETLTYYFDEIKQETKIPEIRRKLQSYRTILKNINNGVELSETEQKEILGLFHMLEFFGKLEERYRNTQRYKYALDSEEED